MKIIMFPTDKKAKSLNSVNYKEPVSNQLLTEAFKVLDKKQKKILSHKAF